MSTDIAENDRKISTREINKKNILKIVKNHSPISRIDIASRLKISRPTVSAYIHELIAKGLINEVGFGESTQLGGKKPRLLEFNSKWNYILGAKIGVRTTSAAITDLDATIIELARVPTEEWLGPDAVIKKLKGVLYEVMEKSGIPKNRIIGIGIGASGLIDSDRGVIVFSPNVSGWSNIPLAQIIEEEFRIRTFVDNECRVQAIAEKYRGLARNCSDFVCVYVAVGVGSGIFIDSKVFRGSNQRGGEMGHVTVVESGVECHCGNYGCLETVASIRKLINDVILRVKDDPTSSLYKKIHSGRKIEIEDIYKAYDRRESVVMEEVLKNAYWVGVGIANTMKVIDPEIVIIHGKVVPFGERYLGVICETVRKITFPKARHDFKIKFTELGETISLVGAAVMVFDKIFGFSEYDVSKEFIVKE